MFHDRLDAADRLAGKLRRFRGRREAIVLAIPRGGLVIGAALARKLNLKLDVILTKKIGHPDNPEWAIGAVGLTGQIIDEALIRREKIPSRYIDAEIARIRGVLADRHRRYHAASRPLPIAGAEVILTDDGAATGRTLLVAVELLRREGAAKITVALPVAPPDIVELLRSLADEVVCLETPASFAAIGEFYEDFSQVGDEEAVAIMNREARGAMTH